MGIAINLLNGISYGMILFIIASGLSLIFGAMGVLNLAHGAFYVLGAYIGLTLVKQGSHFFLAALAAGAFVGLVGLALERLFVGRLYKQINDQVLLTLGLVYIFWNVILWIWGPRAQIGGAPPILQGAINMGSFSYPLYRLTIILMGAVIFVGLWLFQEKTRTGAIMRAGMDDKQMTIGLGINYGLFSSFIFFLGAFLGGLAGFLGTPIIGIQPGLSIDILLFAVIVIVVGGVGNVQGALLGAVLIGVIDGFGKAYFPDFALFTVYLAMIIILLSRPYGLLGRAHWESAAKGQPGVLSGPSRQVRQSPLILYGIYVLIGIACILLPPFVSAYARTMIAKILIYGIFALSLNLLFGYAGLFSLGHAAFFGFGAYTAAILIARCSMDSFWLVIVISLLGTAIAAAFFGIISLKVSGIYFLLVTLAVGQLLDSVAVKWRSLTGGSDGIVAIPYPNIGIPGFTMTSTSFYYFVLICSVICFFLLYRIAKSPFGQVLQGIRGDERRMQCLGYNTWLYKYITLIVGGTFAGMAGILSMYQSGFVGPGELGVLTSTTAMLMVILGSDRVFWGPLLGAALVMFLEYFSSLYTPERWPLILGGAFVLSVTFLRGGVALHLVKILKKV